MSNIFGFLLAVGLAWFAVDAYASAQYVAAAVFVLGLVATLFELMREREG